MPRIVMVLVLVFAAASCARAGLVLGEPVQGSLIERYAPDGGDPQTWEIFNGTTPLVDPFREFAGFVQPDAFAFSTSAYANLSTDSVQVGFTFLPFLGGNGAAIMDESFLFEFINLPLRPGESIVGLDVLNDQRSGHPYTFSFTASSIQIVLAGFALGAIASNDPTPDDNSLTLSIRTAFRTVPEPASLVLAMPALVVALALRKRSRARAIPIA